MEDFVQAYKWYSLAASHFPASETENELSSNVGDGWDQAAA